MTSIFDYEEPSDLSRVVMDGERHKRMSKETRWGMVVGTFVVLFASMLLVGSYVHSNSEVSESGDVKEVNGVLYYPDGQPIRNYEQLNVYLNGR